MNGKALQRIGWVAVAAAIAAAWSSDRLLLGATADAVAHRTQRLAGTLSRRGVALLLTFDGAKPVEYAWRGRVQCHRTTRVPGPFGDARAFDGAVDGFIETDVAWPELGPAYTLSLWARLDDAGRDQELWYTSFQLRRTGLKLVGGNLTLFVPLAETTQSIAYAFTSFGRFVHLVAVVDGPAGRAAIYEDGVLRAEGPIQFGGHPAHNMEFGKMRWSAVAAPLRGAIDHAVAWRRALTPEEIRGAIGSGAAQLRAVGRSSYRAYRLAGYLRGRVLALMKTLDRFDLFLHEGRVEAADLPDVALHFSRSDARHFAHAHEDSLHSGRRTDRAARPRRIHAQIPGRTVEARLELAGTAGHYPPSRRPSYLLRLPEGSPWMGANDLYVFPPESAADVCPPGWPHAPGDRVRLCRLYVDGQLKGLYCIESFDRVHSIPGGSPRLTMGPKDFNDWPELFRNEPPAAGRPFPRFPDEAAVLIAQDFRHPWSSREWMWRSVRSASDPPAGSTGAFPSALDILADNPSAMYVVSDLTLGGVDRAGRRLEWISSNPDVIDGSGRVRRPPGHVPVDVAVSVEAAGGGAEAPPEPFTFTFRVMPEQPRLPALMLYFGSPVHALRRTDFYAWYYPAGTADPPRRLQGVQATGGGIKNRGLASYHISPPGRKPFSLQFDEPHRIIGGGSSRHLYLLNSYRDDTHLRNPFAYEIFRAWAAPGHPRHAPQTAWVELFVNGVYAGVYDLCTRLRSEMFVSAPAEPRDETVLFKINGPATLFADTALEGIRQVSPDPERLDRYPDILGLLAFTSGADPETFAAEAGRRLDLDNIIDFILLLNFTTNEDGRTMNFYLARSAAEGSPFFLIPWDYDRTFGGRRRWQSNHLFDRLAKEVPGFRERMAARWRALREGPLEAGALDSRLREMASALSDCMPWDARSRGRPPDWSYGERVDELCSRVRLHLGFMDEKLGYTPP